MQINANKYKLTQNKYTQHYNRIHRKIPKRQHHESKDIEQLQQYLLHYECEENKKHRGWSRLKAVLTMCGRSGS